MNINAGAIEALIPLAMGILATITGFSKRYDTPKWEKFRRVRWLGPALILFAGFLFLKSRPVPQLDTNTIAEQIRTAAKLPMQIDDQTTFSDVRPLGEKHLGFYFTLQNLAHNAPEIPGLMEQVDASLKGNACKDKNYLTFFKEGLSLSVIYMSKDGLEAHRLNFTPAECGF